MKDIIVSHSKWLVLVGLGVLVAAILIVPRLIVYFRTKNRAAQAALPDPELGFYFPKMPRFVREKIDAAHEEAVAARAEVKAVTKEKKEQLEIVKQIPDPKERRERLAALLRSV